MAEKENIFKRAIKKIDAETDKAWFPAVYGAVAGAMVGLLGWACGNRYNDRETGKHVANLTVENRARVAEGKDPIPHKFLDGPEMVFIERDAYEESEPEETSSEEE